MVDMFKREKSYLVTYLDPPVGVRYAMEVLAKMQLESNSYGQEATIELEDGRLAVIVPGPVEEYGY